MTPTFRHKIVAVATGVLVAMSMTGVAQAVDAYPPGIKPVKCKIKTIKNDKKLKINMGPNQPGSRYYTFKIDIKKHGKWYRYLHNYKTQGTKETKVVNFPKGKYRAHCNGKFGYTSANSATVKLKS